MNVQANQNLCWVHMSLSIFSDNKTHNLDFHYIVLDKLLFQSKSIDIFLISP